MRPPGPAPWDYESRIVGTHPTDDLVVVRVEADGLAAPKIDLVLYDAAGGSEKKRYSILDLDDEGDANIRAAHWKAAEAELNALGVVFDATAEPLPFAAKGGVPEPLTLDGAELSFVMGYDGEGDEAARTLHMTLKRDDAVVESRELARWTGRSANDYHYVRSLWPLPERRLAVIEASGCREPGVHFVVLRAGQ